MTKKNIDTIKFVKKIVKVKERDDKKMASNRLLRIRDQKIIIEGGCEVKMTELEFWWTLPYIIMLLFIVMYLIMYLLFSKDCDSRWEER